MKKWDEKSLYKFLGYLKELKEGVVEIISNIKIISYIIKEVNYLPLSNSLKNQAFRVSTFPI